MRTVTGLGEICTFPEDIIILFLISYFILI
jgi:hypothetical protein